QDRRLARRVERAPALPVLAGDAAHVDDGAAAAPAQMRRRLADEEGAAHEIDLERPQPFLAARLQPLVEKGAGVVDEDVDAAEGRDRRLDAAPDLLVARHVRAL